MDDFLLLGMNRHRMHTDGKGITTLAALAGCPLSCRYCINREALACTDHIETVSPGALVERLAIDHCYFVYTGGGVTFGGGEPLLQSRQITAFAKLCPMEWNITLETSLNVPPKLLAPLLSDRFSFIVDIKAMQPEIYKDYTGMDNSRAVKNLISLSTQIPLDNYIVKVPVIPGYSDSLQAEASVRELQNLGVPAQNIVTFRYTAS